MDRTWARNLHAHQATAATTIHTSGTVPRRASITLTTNNLSLKEPQPNSQRRDSTGRIHLKQQYQQQHPSEPYLSSSYHCSDNPHPKLPRRSSLPLSSSMISTLLAKPPKSEAATTTTDLWKLEVGSIHKSGAWKEEVSWIRQNQKPQPKNPSKNNNTRKPVSIISSAPQTLVRLREASKLMSSNTSASKLSVTTDTTEGLTVSNNSEFTGSFSTGNGWLQQVQSLKTLPGKLGGDSTSGTTATWQNSSFSSSLATPTTTTTSSDPPWTVYARPVSGEEIDEEEETEVEYDIVDVTERHEDTGTHESNVNKSSAAVLSNLKVIPSSIRLQSNHSQSVSSSHSSAFPKSSHHATTTEDEYSSSYIEESVASFGGDTDTHNDVEEPRPTDSDNESVVQQIEDRLDELDAQLVAASSHHRLDSLHSVREERSVAAPCHAGDDDSDASVASSFFGSGMTRQSFEDDGSVGSGFTIDARSLACLSDISFCASHAGSDDGDESFLEITVHSVLASTN